MPQRMKATGTRGSWFARVEGIAEPVPCVHEHWLAKYRYHDPHVQPGIAKNEEFAHSIKALQKVILTRDIVNEKELDFKRTSYIALYEIGEYSFSEDGLSFLLTRKVAELE